MSKAYFKIVFQYIRPEQCDLLRLARLDGKFAAVAHGADAAKAAFLFYLNGDLHGVDIAGKLATLSTRE